MSERQQDMNRYTLADIELYLQGRLSPAEMHAIERAALQDPLLADAIEGYRETDLDLAKQHLAGVYSDLASGISQPATVRNMHRPAWWRIAAAIVVITGAAAIGWLVWSNTVPAGRELADQPQAPAPATIGSSPRDSAIRRAELQRREQAATAAKDNTTARPQAKSDMVQSPQLPPVNPKSLVAANRPEVSAAYSPAPPPPPLNEDAARQGLSQRNDSPAIPGAAEGRNASASRIGGVKNDLSPAPFVIAGRVTDQASRPLAGAIISLSDGKTTTTTDSRGEFRLLPMDSAAKVSIGAVGFENKELPVTLFKQSKPVAISLQEVRQSLDELVITNVTGRTAKRSGGQSMQLSGNNTANVSGLSPANGWASLRTAIKQAAVNRGFAKDTAAVTGIFMVNIGFDAAGNVSDVKITSSSTAVKNVRTLITDEIKKVPSWLASGKRPVNTTANVSLIL